MAKAKQSESALIPERGWLTLKQASVLCHVPVSRLRAMIRSGELRAFTIERDGKQKFRLNRSSLVDAGLLKVRQPDDPAASFDLLTLIRDQNDRIARLEDQRAQLSGQLGIALERLRSIDDRLRWIEEIEHVSESNPEPEPTPEAQIDAIVASLQPESQSRLAPALNRIPQRPKVFVVRSFRRVADVTSRRRGGELLPEDEVTS